MAVKQSTVRIPQELFEAIQQIDKPFNEVVVAALEQYVRARKREEALRMAAEVRESLRRRNAGAVDAVEIVRGLRERGRGSQLLNVL